MTIQVKQTGSGLNGGIIGLVLASWSLLTIAADRAIDDIGLALFQCFIVNPKPLCDTGAEILDHDVCIFQKLVGNLPALIRFEINGKAPLVEIDRQKRRR